MIDWDDVRYFLAVARGGSVRAAAERLGVNHSTVLRRIAQLEERLGAHDVRKAAFGLPPDGCGRGGPRVRGPDGSVVAPAGDARLRSRPERARASAGDAGADPRDTPAHAGLRRFRASASGDRDGDPAVRRAGESDQPRGRCRDPRRLRPQDPAAQSSRPEGTGAVRRRLHVPRPDWPRGVRARPIRSGGSSSASMASRTGRARARFAPRGFRSGPRTARRRSWRYGKGSG